ncbi:hypothetical protein CF327_g2854 [Tilletia walkeri]|uniref:tyrosinase n=1 Tax=Tilletia walkeri TaxID=117179 RepID=A0A8X7NB19_9BASI|nr:hypothetical protein CF327_g2854 [Tilletia walkeri]KAE8269672.1 hypothetical protein A4X09_0g2670 [Tilletia walkeri]
MEPTFVKRKNIRSLSPQEKDDLIRAFDAIQKLDPRDPNSFFTIAGYHGEPFRGAGYANPAWWGGYCNHGNVLFPTWHRGYCLLLEKALQRQVPSTALHYWDETEAESLEKGIPSIFTDKSYKYNDTGDTIPNPLFSYKFQTKITDMIDPIPDYNYSKAAGDETVRYPFSSLVGTPQDRINTLDHNSKMGIQGDPASTKMLNDNVTTWLTKSSFFNNDGERIPAGIHDKYVHCLNAPNYTVFSNTTSAVRWNDDHKGENGFQTVVPLESPHNSMHLALGGFTIDHHSSGQILGANGDMGENDTASFDPIFYFHHSFIDLLFWRWQKKHNQTESLEVIDAYPGTNSVDSQGPTPGVASGTWLTLDSPLEPFKNPHDPSKTMISRDVVDIAKLGYSYDFTEPIQAGKPHGPSPILTVGGINRAAIGGSFVISAWAKLESGKKVLVGTEAVLSRWRVANCQNCQTHLEVRTHIPLEGWTKEEAEEAEEAKGFEIVLHTRNQQASRAPKGGLGQVAPKPRYTLHTAHLD